MIVPSFIRAIRALKMPSFLIIIATYVAIAGIVTTGNVFNFSYLVTATIFLLVPFFTNRYIPKRMLVTALPGILLIINFLIQHYAKNSFIYFAITIIILASLTVVYNIHVVRNLLMIFKKKRKLIIISVIFLPIILVGILYKIRVSLFIVGVCSCAFFVFDFRRQYLKYMDLQKTYKRYKLRGNNPEDFFLNDTIILKNCNSFCSRQAFVNAVLEKDFSLGKKLRKELVKRGYRNVHFFPTTDKSLVETFLDDYKRKLKKAAHRKKLRLE